MMDIPDPKDRAPKISYEWAEKGEEQYDIIVSMFYQPLDHKEEMKGVFLAPTLLAWRKLEQWKGTHAG